MGTTDELRAVDCWVNPITPGQASSSAPEFLKAVARDTFHREEEVFRDRAVTEAKALPFREGVLERFLRDNALDFFRWS